MFRENANLGLSDDRVDIKKGLLKNENSPLQLIQGTSKFIQSPVQSRKFIGYNFMDGESREYVLQ